ncbi:unnamed protein product [Gongylonema pulchrum]|uniref:Ras-associating domain-containing protein n=1 Tax=Gongylonema pulchrum TaxID=637853 RepID=A0A183EAD5_9BILA|nr:unnamed protein product [Gongylonema pulchrum]
MTVGDDYARNPLMSTHSVSQIPPRGSSRRSNLGSSSMVTRRSAAAAMDANAPMNQSSNSSSSPVSTYDTSSSQGSFSVYQNSNSSLGPENCADMDREILGDGEVPRVEIPDMQSLERYLQPLGLTLQHALRFIEGYTTNCGEVLECVKQLHFDAVEECWLTFWQPENEQEDMEEEDCAPNELEVLECVKQLHFDAVEECWLTFWQPENEQEDMEEEDCAPNELVNFNYTAAFFCVWQNDEKFQHLARFCGTHFKNI